MKPLPAPGSLLWTPWLIALLGLAAVGAAREMASPAALLGPPVALLGVNLLAAILANASFRAQPALLVFHVALLMAALLLGLGRLTYQQGWVELPIGEAFAGELSGIEQGWLHWGDLQRLVFVNEGFAREYGPDWRVKKKRTTLRWRDEEGVWRRSELGAGESLLLHGYRIDPTSNHGFAPVFEWSADPQATPIRGAVHFPSYPLYREQSHSWTIPGTDTAVLAMLLLEEAVIHPALGGVFPALPRHRLRVTAQGETRDLVPGDRFPFPGGGELRYVAMSFWMGYRVAYDWARYWLLAAFLVASGSLAWHYWRKFPS
ncbi:MAG: hypothetical protein HQL96_10730 [Magnetococcales bacterium]|nr:hypothetical protein [Magnetococcales bacterium]